ncbi:MAG: hypothetical protein IJE09_08705 [Oscillospiraceae bacterium]|nr:hypothetical protein [Oscillospiraceae bacterium]
MSQIQISQELMDAIDMCLKDPEIIDRSFFPEFSQAWNAIFERARQSKASYFDIASDSCYTVHCDFMELSFDFHFDQLKMAEWYDKELKNRKKVVFSGKKLKHSWKTKELMYDNVICHYEPSAEEPALGEHNRNIIVCAMPGLPPTLQVVYGNKFVKTRFNPLRTATLGCFLIGTDYVPAFLASPMEVAVYLFMMDLCIIKENYRKVKDKDLKRLLHALRVSPMLRIKGLA